MHGLRFVNRRSLAGIVSALAAQRPYPRLCRTLPFTRRTAETSTRCCANEARLPASSCYPRLSKGIVSCGYTRYIYVNGANPSPPA